MKQKILKQISFLAAFICMTMGLLYLILWYSTSGHSVFLSEFGYPAAIGIILIGLGIISLYGTTQTPWTNYIGAILSLLSLAHVIHILFLEKIIINPYPIFQHSNPLNVISRLLMGILFLFWRRKDTPQLLYSFGFFTGFLELGFGVFGLCARLLGISVIYETHPIGLILSMISGLGILSAMIKWELSRKINLYKWVPIIIGTIWFVFVVLVSFAIYLNEQLFVKYTKMLIVFNFTGDILASLMVALLAYFWLLSKIRLESVRNSEAKFRAFVETTNDWVWEINKEGCFTYSNPTVKKILGYSSEELLGKKLLDYLSKDGQVMIEKAIKEATKEKREWIGLVSQYISKDGSICYLESNAEPVFDKAKEVIGFRGADRDITERMKLEKLHNEFIATVSHELRTPITSINGALGLLLQGEKFSEKGKELLEIAYRNSERLRKLIKEILDIQTPSAQLNVHLKPVSLPALIHESILVTKPFADKLQVSLIEESPLPDIEVNADYDRLIQVMANLLSNAIKFSPPQGNVFISLLKIDDSARISIRDQGSGIPKEFQPRMFEPFAQAKTKSARLIEGTGLGLPICKKIVEQLGGKINFTSQENVGTTFYFELPILKKE